MELGIVYVVHAVFFLFMDLFVFLKTFVKRKESPSQQAFSHFAVTVICLQLVAVGVIVADHSLVHVAGPLRYLLYYLIVTLPVVSTFCAAVWLIRMFEIGKGKWTRGLKISLALPVILYALVNAISYRTHWTFYVDEAWNYHRGNLFFLQLLIPYTYVFGIIILLVREKLKRNNIYNGHLIKFLSLYVIPPVCGSFIQVFGNLQGCFAELGVSVALILVYIGMYMGDAEEHRRIKDLADFNEKLQFANDQMRRILMRGELQAKTVAETIQGGFKIGKYDKNFSFVYISEQLAQMLGYTVAEMMEVSGGSMIPLINRDEAREGVPRAKKQIAAGEVFTLNYSVRCKDGSWKHVEERGRLIKSEGAEDEIWSVIMDRDEVVQVETALAKVEKSRKELAEYNDIIATAGMGIWFVTLQDGKPGLLHGNDKFYELMGIDGSKMSREEVHEFLVSRILPEDLPVFGAAIDKMKKGQFAEALYRWNHPTKGVIYNRCGGTAVQLPDGSYQLSGYHGDATEIVTNERKQQELLKNALAAAEESNRAKTSFLNNMSHDIRTPMNAILGFANLMEKEIGNPEMQKEYLRKLKSSGDFLLSLINNVLEMARIESGKIELNETPVCLSNRTDETIGIFDVDLKEHNLKITTFMDVQHNYVYADMVKIREVLVNLISNSIKYSKVNGRINTSMREVPCAREGYAAYEFVVEDDGIGMSEEFLPHIFESFVRERNSTESKIVGTGLGLPIVKKLVDLMGGKITVESKLGVGTKFTVYFEHRICSPEDVTAVSVSQRQEETDLKGKRILLAEDNDLNAEIAMALLGDEGILAERAVDGVTCIDMLQKADVGYYSAILMDIQMPNMDGYEATRRIRQMDNPRRGIPIVAMTANAFAEDKQNALNAGMNGHVAKPIDLKVLVKTLTELL